MKLEEMVFIRNKRTGSVTLDYKDRPDKDSECEEVSFDECSYQDWMTALGEFLENNNRSGWWAEAIRDSIEESKMPRDIAARFARTLVEKYDNYYNY